MTVTNMIALVKQVFPSEADADVLAYLQSKHDYLCERYWVRRGTETVSLTANTGTYNLPSSGGTVINVMSARYQTSANTSYQIQPRTVTDLDQTLPGWQEWPSSQPVYYYTDGGAVNATVGRIGFQPVPDTTTSGSYPRVILDVAYTETLTTSGSPGTGEANTLPPGCGSNLAWYYGTLRRLAEKKNDPRAGEFMKMESDEDKRLQGFLAKAEEATVRTRPRGFMRATKI